MQLVTDVRAGNRVVKVARFLGRHYYVSMNYGRVKSLAVILTCFWYVFIGVTACLEWNKGFIWWLLLVEGGFWAEITS